MRTALTHGLGRGWNSTLRQPRLTIGSFGLVGLLGLDLLVFLAGHGLA